MSEERERRTCSLKFVFHEQGAETSGIVSEDLIMTEFPNSDVLRIPTFVHSNVWSVKAAAVD